MANEAEDEEHAREYFARKRQEEIDVAMAVLRKHGVVPEERALFTCPMCGCSTLTAHSSPPPQQDGAKDA